MKKVMMILIGLSITLTITGVIPPTHAARWIFDSSCLSMAGSHADWVIDAPEAPGNQSIPHRYPTPSQCEIGADTPEDFWHGGYSAWGVELVKAGNWVETIIRNDTLTYGDCTNDQDLSFFDVLVIPEPQIPYSEAEIDAIVNFVFDGGGLFLIGNHCGSDRNNTGEDSAMIFAQMDTAGHFGIEFETYEGCIDDPPPPECAACSWNDVRNTNFTTDPSDPFLHGPYGDVEAIKFNEATSLILHPANNSSVQGHAWRDDGPQGEVDVTVASAFFGDGRVVAIGDSAPADDGTGDEDDFLHNSWDYGSSENDILFMNISHWLTRPDATPLPTRTPCPAHTPWPKCDGTATPAPPTPTPTSTPTGGNLPFVDISTNKIVYYEGDNFILSQVIVNSGPGRTVDYYLALEAGGAFFFAPTWTQDVNWSTMYLYSGYSENTNVFEFVWPNAGAITGLRFWALLLDPQSGQMIGDFDMTEFNSAG